MALQGSLFVGFCTIATAFLAVSCSVAADRKQLEDALEDRASQFVSFEIEWVVSGMRPNEQPDGLTRYRAVVDGDRIRLIRTVQDVRDPLTGGAVSFTDEFSDNGEAQYSFIHTLSQGSTPTGNVSRRKRIGQQYHLDFNVLPILLYFRPQWKHIHQLDIRSSDFTSNPDGLSVLTHTPARHRVTWGMPPLFPIRSWENIPPPGSQFRPQWKTRIFSETTVSGEQIPRGWTSTQYDERGSVVQIHSARVLKFMANPVIEESVFRIDFPEGTPVINGDDPEHKFVVRADGTFRPVSARDSFEYGSWLEMARAPVDR